TERRRAPRHRRQEGIRSTSAITDAPASRPVSVLGLGNSGRLALVILIAAVLGGRAGLPPGADFPKIASVALAHPEETRLGGQFERTAREHGGTSGFRIITVGIDGFLTRVQMIDAAQRTLNLQYFIFRGDETGRLLTAAVLRAADRGVRVRVLVDDGDTVTGDKQIIALDGHPAIEIRVF